MFTTLFAVLALIVVTPPEVSSEEAAQPAPAPAARVQEVRIEGELHEHDLTFDLALDLTTTLDQQRVDLIAGDVALIDDANSGTEALPGSLSYDPETHTYRITFTRAGHYQLTLHLAARATIEKPQTDAPDNSSGAWRSVSFTLPGAKTRPITLHSQRADVELDLPGAVRVQRAVKDNQLTVTAIQGGQSAFMLRWKPQVQALDAELVVSSEINTIATIASDAVRLDELLQFDIAQGRLEQVTLLAPIGLNVTQVRGPFIRDWRLDPVDDQHRLLVITLNRPQTQSYRLQVLAESPVPAFPAEVDLLTLEPTGGIRGGGHLAVGTDSAIQLQVRSSTGLAQINADTMPHVALDDQYPRPMPSAKLFCYSFPGPGYRMRLALDHVTPAYDAMLRHVLRLETENAELDSEIELDVRDAAIGELTLIVPPGFNVVSVTGNAVSDYRVLPEREGEAGTPLRVMFKQPQLGRCLVRVKLELGRAPLDQAVPVTAPCVQGAANQRGYLLVAAEQGLQLDAPKVKELREVATGSTPLRVPDAQFAYRFRGADWSIHLHAALRPPGIRMEAFHLISLGDGVAYGSTALSYFITGSPVDRLQFVIVSQLDNIQFVGRDVRRWQQDEHDPSLWTVTLQRKVIGDYNLGITWTQRYDDAHDVLIGGVCGRGIETQIGYVAVASHLNLKLNAAGDDPSGLLPIDRQELPENYRALVSAPLLQCYKYVATPRETSLHLTPYERGTLAPVVIELTEAQTQIVPRNDGQTESVTRIRYKIKNSSSQFLALTMPAHASVWSARIIERGEKGDTTSHRVAAAVDPNTKRLLIPLTRPRDPNAPITLELEFGQVHGNLGVSGQTTLIMPVSDARSTFDSWTVRVPKDWAILPARANPAGSGNTSAHHGSVAAVLGSLAQCWREGWQRFMRPPLGPAALIAAGAVVVVMLLMRRSLLPEALVAVLLVLLIWIGALAVTAPTFRQRVAAADDLTTLNQTQVIDLDLATPLTADVRIVPSWRQHATFVSAVIAPIVVLVGLASAWFLRRWRPVLLAVACTALIIAACQFPLTSRIMGHLLTWGVPAILAVFFLWRVVWRQWIAHRRIGNLGVVTTASLAMMLVTLSGCTTTPRPDPQASKAVVLRELKVSLTAEQDSLAGELNFTARAVEPTRVTLLPAEAIVLQEPAADSGMSLRRSEHGYDLLLKQTGEFHGQVRFLLPLARFGEGQGQQFALPLPVAMSKSASLDIPRTSLDVALPDAVHTSSEETDGVTHVAALLGPNDGLRVVWTPRARQRALEQTQFFVTATSAVKFDAGLIEARHELHFEIAQGELSLLRVAVPKDMTVTTVQGQDVGAWRYDAAAGELEVRLSRPAAGDYLLRLVTQIAQTGDSNPVILAPLRVAEAARQRGSIGLLTSEAVDITVGEHPPTINPTDFARDAAELLQRGDAVRFACRANEQTDRVLVAVMQVRPEIRSMENATFSVADDRLVYVGGLDMEITKAGVFDVSLAIPEGYDVDALNAEGMSHWDEQVDASGRRIATIHFASKRIGPVAVKLAMSRPMTGLPASLDAPRVGVVDTLKHSGRMVILAERGVRLTVTRREGVSELNATDVGIHQPGALVFSLLRPNWSLALRPEVLEARITAESLHVATVGDGLVKHTHHLRYNLRQAGIKELTVRVQPDALGLTILGPNIARRQPVEGQAGLWRIELTGKWYDPTYLLTVSYETRLQSDQPVVLHPVRAEDADLQSCYIAARAADRVELTPMDVIAALQNTEARTIPRSFGAGDLSDAALAYRANAADYELKLKAVRHAAAQLLAAEVLSSELTSVITERGQAVHHVQMQLRVTSKRNLEMRLPAGAEIWSLLVDGRAALPSIRRDGGGEPVYLTPLTQSAAGDLPVSVDIVYVTMPATDWRWSEPTLEGPRFDLPLKNVRWIIYAPQDYRYGNFAGTMSFNEDATRRATVAAYGVDAYEQEVRRYQVSNLVKAKAFQSKGNDLAVRGDQRAARQALENAYNYSLGDAALNEDARVQLNRLNRDQALLGLVQSRGRLRQMDSTQPTPQQQQNVQEPMQAELQQIERLRASLSQSDSENLDMIVAQLIETQAAAASNGVPMMVNMPLRGKVLSFERAIQVEPDSAMTVRFRAEPVEAAAVNRPYTWPGGVLLVLLLIFAGAPRVVTKVHRWRMSGVVERGADDGFFDEEPGEAPQP